MERIGQYGMFEKSFRCVHQEAVLSSCGRFVLTEADGEEEAVQVSAFRTGEGQFTVRFMPWRQGLWRYEIAVGDTEIFGEFLCTEPEKDCHGRVTVREEGFCYEDGSKFLPFGTTCYAWIYQPPERQEQTLDTLRASCFNKLRMLVFPKHMPYNNEEPERFPFLRDVRGKWDIGMPDYGFWDNLDEKIRRLGEMGMEVDLILFHPYDKWGFSELSREESMRYLEYCIARLSAFHNLWWSLANEYEMLVRKRVEDWDAIGEFVREQDAYGHLISIHNIMQVYPKRDWMTHCSIQSSDINRVPYWKKKYGIPVLIDECGYEGDLEFVWGNLSAFDMADRFWWTLTRGAYCTHGETFHREDEVLWWSKGGKLYGESEARIRFLKELLYSLPGVGTAEPLFTPPNPNELRREEKPVNEQGMRYLELVRTSPEEEKFGTYADRPKRLLGEGWQLTYFGHSCPCMMRVRLPEGTVYDAELIDIWEMTRTALRFGLSGEEVLELPGKEGMAVLLRLRK